MKENHILFFTATILNWNNLLEPNKYKQIIVDSLKYLVEKEKIIVYAFVIMPNHIHILWRIINNNLLSDIQRDFLKFTSQMIKYDLIKNKSKLLNKFISKRKDRKFQFWQDHSYNIRIFNRKVLEQKLDYIHKNPLAKKWNLVNNPEEYYYSSASFYKNEIKTWDFLTHYIIDI